MGVRKQIELESHGGADGFLTATQMDSPGGARCRNRGGRPRVMQGRASMRAGTAAVVPGAWPCAGGCARWDMGRRWSAVQGRAGQGGRGALHAGGVAPGGTRWTAGATRGGLHGGAWFPSAPGPRDVGDGLRRGVKSRTGRRPGIRAAATREPGSHGYGGGRYSMAVLSW